MSYDPTKPANNSPVSSAELRSQLAGLKQLIDDLPSSQPNVDAIMSNSAGAVMPVLYLNLTVSNPPTQAQVQAIADKLDELLVFLRRE